MSQENVEIVRASIAAFNTGGVEAALGTVHPEIEWFTHAVAPDMVVFRGHDGLREMAAMLEEVLGEIRIETDQFLDTEDQVVVVGRLHITGAGSGVATESHRAWVYTLRDGEIVRVRTYPERDQALEAAGLQR